MHAVARTLDQDEAIEAVTIDHAERRILLATMGQQSADQAEARLTRLFEHAYRPEVTDRCRLLEGDPDCAACPIGPDATERARLTFDRQPDRLTIARATCPTARRLWRWRDLPWPRVAPREVEIPEDEHAINAWKPQLLAAGLCGVFGLAGWWFPEPAVAVSLRVLSFLAGGWFAAIEVWERLRERVVDVHFLMLAVALGAAAIGHWDEGAVLLFLFSLSGALEHYALGRTQREIRALFRTAPKEALVLEPDGRERRAPVEELRPGQRLRIRPDAQFPVDAELVKGRTAADESNLTGEATPVPKAPGDTLLAGTLNLWGSVEAVVLRPAQESALQRIVRLIREAQHLKAPSQRLTDRFGSRYTVAILGLTMGMFFVWWLLAGAAPWTSPEGGRSAFDRAMTLLVVASPCALVLSIPSAVLAAIAWGARHGVLFRGGAAVENLAETGVVAMDKTGTLTTGDLRVARVESFPPGREEEVGRLAYSLERLSEHPLARAITRHGRQAGWEAEEVEQFESVPGLGLRARWRERTVLLGRREWLADQLRGADGDLAVRRGLEAHDGGDAVHSEVWLAAGDLLGRLVLEDDLREAAPKLIGEFRRLGLRTVVLTGDRPAAAEALRRALRLDEVRAGLKPEQKVQAIVDLGRDGRRVAMVGDGVNDAPSLAAAHVGVAMGARGSDAALEQADVVLMHDRLENFLAAFRLSQRARRIIRQNLFISLGTVVVLVTCALAGAVPLTLGVLGHEGSTVLVVLNSLRLIFGRDQKQP